MVLMDALCIEPVRCAGMESNLQKYPKRSTASVLFVGGLVIFSSSGLHWWWQNPTMAVLTALNGLTICALAAWVHRSRTINALPILIATVAANIFCAAIIVRLQEVGIYWFYPLLMAVAFILPWRWSLPVNLANVAVALGSAAQWMPDTHYARLVATLLIALMFSGLFSFSLARQQRMLHDLAVHDPLTGAYNRRHFVQMLDEVRRHWKRTGRKACMLLIDLDHFKKINDGFGHGVGDRVLVAFCQYLADVLRPTDRFFRLGGEEFAILLPETSAAQGAKLAERLRARLADGPLATGLPAFTISCGVADYPESNTDREWPQDCDAALYAAKAAGRNRVVSAT